MAEQIERVKIRIKFLNDAETDLEGHYFHTMVPNGNGIAYLAFVKSPVSVSPKNLIYVPFEYCEKIRMHDVEKVGKDLADIIKSVNAVL
ncbi:hypothetical protein HYV80_00765 [Candidatus Woesearchaeota archaeon]|nr:hypothetical protein [Candidatus Woesearchaeota archaeon]